jgi:hypothetical protein
MDGSRGLTARATTMTHVQDQLSLDEIRQIDAICDKFEQSCLSEQPANISTLLSGWKGPQRSALVSELVLIDLHYAGRRPDRRQRDDYLALLPDDGPAIDRAFEKAVDKNISTRDASGMSTAARNNAASLCDGETPQQIGRYRIEGRLGAGAFGVVYLAHDPDLNRRVAIKCPKPGVWRADSRWEMFRREAEHAAKLRHPGVVAIYDIGRDERGGPYFVMDYIRGESLKDRLARSPLPPRDARQIAIALAEALDCIHQAGLVHRDLKPANVLLDEAGHPHIADLGLALDAYDPTAEELAVTFAYMAPEQAPTTDGVGEAPRADYHCDIWAVGVILYEMLAGRRPFDAATCAELFHQIHHDPPRPLTFVDAQVDPSVAQICMKCLAKKPQLRFASAGALAAALRRAPDALLKKSAPRRTAMLAGGVLAGLGAALASFWFRTSDNAEVGPIVAGAAEQQAAATASPVRVPYVIRGGGERFADLSDAVATAVDGATIEIDADGPIDVDQVDAGDRRLTICAAQGRRPVLTLADETRLCLLRTEGALELEGLELRRAGARSQNMRNPPSLLYIEEPGSLRVKNCRIVASTGDRMPCVRAAGNSCDIEDSELINDNGAAVMWFPVDGAKLSFDNCVAEVDNLIIVHDDGDAAITAQVHRSTVRAQHVIVALGSVHSSAETRLEVTAERCSFDVDAIYNRILPFHRGTPETLEQATESLAWQGKQNVFAVRDTFVRSTVGGRRRSQNVDNLAAWNELWGTQSGSVEMVPTEARAAADSFNDSIPTRAPSDLASLADEREIGFVAGARIDSVGPEARHMRND